MKPFSKSMPYGPRGPSARHTGCVRRGYALLTVLAILTLAAMALSGLAREGLMLSLEASGAVKDLERRWAVLSAQRAILWRAEYLLRREAIRHREAALRDTSFPLFPEPREIEAEIQLGDLTLLLRLADEDAKVNINTLYRRRGESAVTAAAIELGQAVGGLPIHLRPLVGGDPRRLVQHFDSFGQIFALADAHGSEDSAESLKAATALLTCWGQGRLNLRRAADQAVEQVGLLVLPGPEVEELLEARAETTTEDLEAVFSGLGLRASRRMAVAQLFSTESTCHSLWISARLGNRAWHTLSIAEARSLGPPEIQSFVW